MKIPFFSYFFSGLWGLQEKECFVNNRFDRGANHSQKCIPQKSNSTKFQLQKIPQNFQKFRGLQVSQNSKKCQMFLKNSNNKDHKIPRNTKYFEKNLKKLWACPKSFTRLPPRIWYSFDYMKYTNFFHQFYLLIIRSRTCTICTLIQRPILIRG